MLPGMTTQPATSRSVRPRSPLPISATFPPAKPTSATSSRPVPGSTTRPLRRTTSCCMRFFLPDRGQVCAGAPSVSTGLLVRADAVRPGRLRHFGQQFALPLGVAGREMERLDPAHAGGPGDLAGGARSEVLAVAGDGGVLGEEGRLDEQQV